MPRSLTVAKRRALEGLAGAALCVASCAAPPPPPEPPPPPPPPVQPIPVTPQEPLSIQGHSQPAGPGKQAVAIFANGVQVISGTLTKAAPRQTFHGKYKDHDIQANCTLVERVDCEILVDGSPESAGGGQPGHERP